MKANTIYLFLLIIIWCLGCSKVKIEREIILPKEDSVFICDGSGNCSLLNAATGTQLWKIRLEGNMTTTPTYFNGLLIVNLVNITDNNSTLLALDIADGKVKWIHELPGTYNSSPTVDKQNIFILSAVY